MGMNGAVQCLTDEDITIRLRALELLTGMVTRRNLPDIVQVRRGVVCSRRCRFTVGERAAIV